MPSRRPSPTGNATGTSSGCERVGLFVTGRSEDGTVELLEDPSCPFVFGVFWHPEEYEKSQPIKSLVSEVS